MHINDLTLKNFRNYNFLNIEFAEKINFIVGENGTGKTNILEGISIVSNIKSFRNINDIEIIQWGGNSYFCSVNINSNQFKKFEIGCMIIADKIKKKIKIDGLDIKKANEYFGKLNIVIFAPVDINIINGTPDNRRKFFDSVFSKVDLDYFNSLNDFRRILHSRNKLLKNFRQKKFFDFKHLDTWDQMFAEKASEIIYKRINYLSEFNKIFQKSYINIADDLFKPEIIYNSSAYVFEKDKIIETLIKYRSRDISTGTTNIGPQRDDYSIVHDNKLLSNIASQGQRRTVAISLKISEMNMIENKKNTKCVVLIDDIFSELDLKRRNNMIEILHGDNQIIFTMVNAESINLSEFNSFKKFTIKSNGEIDCISK